MKHVSGLITGTGAGEV